MSFSGPEDSMATARQSLRTTTRDAPSLADAPAAALFSPSHAGEQEQVLLSPEAWEAALVRATAFAHLLSYRIPRHLAVEDVVHTAVEHVLSGRRSFDPGQTSLAAILCGTIKSLLSPKGLAELNARQQPVAVADQEMERAVAPDQEDGNLFSAADHDRIFALVCEEAGGDAVFCAYVDCFRANHGAEETARRIGVSTSKCYELNRRLKLCLRRVLMRLGPADRPR